MGNRKIEGSWDLEKNGKSPGKTGKIEKSKKSGEIGRLLGELEKPDNHFRLIFLSFTGLVFSFLFEFLGITFINSFFV